ncbi:rab protein geranylgeranyltransferase component A [Hesseltinella vesiculosa]|uniref:Rab escort protein 1 n=1 Tax=Hesseltinella vesiculosa TaxID=101127 RepID=A0A1X2GQL6_9FUNG|nr:rab protein geranylgeranyltransferase component A [Hesseltinella vesiculosa]
MTDQLEDTHFDVIVLGTGLTESIVAGALSRAGKKVLHLDSNMQYGSSWSVYALKPLLDWKEKVTNTDNVKDTVPAFTIAFDGNCKNSFQHVALTLGVNEASAGQDDGPLTEQEESLLSQVTEADRERYISPWQSTVDKDDGAYLGKLASLVTCLKASRQYSLDTCPKLLAARGQLVEDLIRSGVGRYLDFKSVDDMFVFDHGDHALKKVPGSKEDVFTNKSISLVDKRKLMKFLTFAMSDEKEEALLQDIDSQSYADYLEAKFKITGKLQSAVVHGISLSTSNVTAKEGLERTQAFLRSMGRFGRGSYLCAMYGGGSEIAQAFCRTCAVFGGIYILGQSLKSFLVDQESGVCRGVVTADGQEFTAGAIITGFDYLPSEWQPLESEVSWVSKAILVSAEPLSQFTQAGSDQAIGISVIPPKDDQDDLVVVQNQSSETSACPPGQYVTYFSTRSNIDVLKIAVQTMLSSTDQDHREDDPFLFHLVYQQCARSRQTVKDRVPGNLYVCSDPDASLDFEAALAEAKSIFTDCIQDDQVEFMPAPPDMDVDDIPTD